MAEHATQIDMVEVKAADIMGERSGFYGSFMTGVKIAIGAVIAVLVLMAIFLV